MIWEVLTGVGADGVGGLFHYYFFFVFLSFSSFFLVFFFFLFFFFFFAFLLILLAQEQTTATYWKMGNFSPTPSAPTPFRTSRMIGMVSFASEMKKH